MNSGDIEVTNKKEKYLLTVKRLRSSNFSKNLPFLILSEQLPEGQVYREFPDGRIELQEVSARGSRYQSRVIHVLNTVEANRVRREYGLL